MEPTATGGTSGPRVRVEAVYAEALARAGAAGQVDIEALLPRHPELAQELRRIHQDWQRVSAVHAELSARGSLTERLRRTYGHEREPGLSLDPAPGPNSQPARMIESLEAHAPLRSRYEIVEEVARGGMGAVLKVWDPDLRRTLAMKVALTSPGSTQDGSTPGIEEKPLARFLEEAQVTGQLDHPGIVPVHELGLDPAGQVYFTMRLVKGQDLSRIFELARKEEGGWTQTRALGAILKVCEAMAYAHQKLVIHRDLKPANIMVGRFGEVYVMDWGLARVLGREDKKDIRLRREQPTALTAVRTDRREARENAVDSPLMTMDGDVVGTPAYMSPEQARGELGKLDPRTDVYSLGAILYHLLAGHMPYVPPGASLNNYAVWARVQEGPPRPLSESAPGAPAELVAIAEKAMAREPQDRYAGVLELAEDLRSFLEGRVVQAYETGALAEFRKWVRRNKGTAWASAAAILLLLGGVGSIAIVETRSKAELARKNLDLAAATSEAQAASERARTNETRALEEKGRADLNASVAGQKTEEALAAKQEAERTAEQVRLERDAGERVIQFLVGLFESPDPRKAKGETVTAKVLLDRGAQTIGAQPGQDSLTWVRLMDAMGRAYHSLGLHDEALPLLETALGHRLEALGEDQPDTLASLNELASLQRSRGLYAVAEPLYVRALEGERRVLGEEHPSTLATLDELGLVHFYQGRYGEAETLLSKALEARKRVLGEQHADTLESLVDLGLLYRKQARLGEARPLLERALEGYRRLHGEEHPDTLKTLNDLAAIHLLERRYEEARPLYERALEGRKRVLGAEHPDTLTTLNDLAYLHLLEGRYALAEPLYLEALEGCRSALGNEHSRTLTVLNNLAGLYQAQRRYLEAEPLLVEALAGSRKVLGEDHPNTLGCANGLAYLYDSQQRYAEAEPLYKQALAGHRRVLGESHPNTLTILQNLTSLYRVQARFAEAEPQARELLLRTQRSDPEYKTRQALFDAVMAGLDAAEKNQAADGKSSH